MVDLVKKTGVGELLTATPSEVAEVYESVDDVHRFNSDYKSKLDECVRTVFLTQTEYNEIVNVDDNILYMIRPEL